MHDHITIAVDAMGGDSSPNKIIKGISLHSRSSKNSFYKIKKIFKKKYPKLSIDLKIISLNSKVETFR